MSHLPAEELHYLDVGGTRLAYLQRGKGPLLLCVHGFPDTAYSFLPVLERLAAAGYHAVAPFQRGYAPSALAADDDYRAVTLAQDLLALIEALGQGRAAAVVGHDWGSVAAQLAAKQRPEAIARLVLCAVPHLRRFFLFPSLKQIARSHYIFRFQLPRWPEAALGREDHAWLEQVLIRRWSPGWHYREADLAPVKACLRDPQRRRALLAYYRNLPGALLDSAQRRLVMAPIPQPTRMIYGTDDGCIGAEMFDAQEQLFPGGLQLCPAPGMGHFMQAENPAWFAERVLEFLRA